MVRLRICGRCLLFLSVALLSDLSLGSAQAGIGIGIKAGPSFATQVASGNVAPDIERPNREGLSVAVDLEFSLTSALWLRIEPMFVQKGSEIDWPGNDIFDSTAELDYLTFPINVKGAMELGSVRPFLFVGPYFGMVVSAQYVLKSDGTVIDADPNDFDFGLDFGGGAEVHVGRSFWLTIDTRYSLSLTDTSKGEGSSFKNRATIVLVGALVEL